MLVLLSALYQYIIILCKVIKFHYVHYVCHVCDIYVYIYVFHSWT